MRTALLALAAIAGCREHIESTDYHQAGSGVPSPGSMMTRVLYPRGPGSFVELIAAARHGVVAIRAATPVKSGPASMFPGAPEAAADVALGTGFLVETKGVYVLTNDHIAAASTELRVVLSDGSELPAKLIGRDTALDLALLSIDAPHVEPLPLGDSSDVQVGESVIALGNPFGDEVTATAGIVAATGQRAAVSLLDGATMTYRMFIQTDARIHRGNSGGPVLDTAGQVIGIAVAAGDRAGELSFVIPINRAREIFDALRDRGRVTRSWLGAWVKPVTPELASTLALPKRGGGFITDVKAASPAARAGLRTGDVILTWDGRDVDHASLPWLVAQTPAGKSVQVVLWRNKAEFPITIVTEKMPQ